MTILTIAVRLLCAGVLGVLLYLVLDFLLSGTGVAAWNRQRAARARTYRDGRRSARHAARARQARRSPRSWA